MKEFKNERTAQLHRLRTMHLFAGAGGGLLADLLLGHQCICAVEIDPYCQQVLSARQKDGVFPWFPIFGDIREFDGKPWRGLVDIVAGGFPCQNVSPSGDRKGLDGEKSGLWSEMARVVREVEPAHVFVENSSALTVRGLGRVIGDLAQMGFDARWGVLGATDAIWLDGPPAFDHERFRIFIKATHPNRIGKLQSQGIIQDQWGRISHRASASSADADRSRLEGWKDGSGESEIAGTASDNSETSNTNRIRQQSSHKTKKCSLHKNGSYASSESKWGGKPVPINTGDNIGWWSVEPGVGRMVHGLANRNDRIRAIGNGQVPAVVALAWHLLNNEIR